jgi:hypothetical protein
MSGVTQKKIIKNNLCTYFISVWWQCCMMIVSQFDNNLLCFCLKRFAIAIVKMKVYRYNKLRSKLVYRIELLQRAGLGTGTK